MERIDIDCVLSKYVVSLKGIIHEVEIPNIVDDIMKLDTFKGRRYLITLDGQDDFSNFLSIQTAASGSLAVEGGDGIVISEISKKYPWLDNE